MASTSLKLLNLNPVHHSKKWYFWSNLCKSEVMKTFLIKILELPKFGHMSKSTLEFHSLKIFIGKIFDFITFTSKLSSFFPWSARLWNSLPIEYFHLTYNLNGFKSRINRYLLIVGYFYKQFLYALMFLCFFFLQLHPM